MDESRISKLRNASAEAKKETTGKRSGWAVTSVGSEPDSTMTIRINSELKRLFSDLCAREQMTVTQALKRYMLEAIRTDEVI
ncbi:TPA: hypothetical protein NIK51_005229 [Pseudomonas aeruginosa]|nr:hypothetical protein [Pseudomonas aeruginosa]